MMPHIALLLLLCSFVMPLAALAAEPSFEIKLLGIDANEGIAAGDVDGDGKTDLVAGRNWYSGADWAGRPVRNIADWNGYVESNGDFLFDVDADGDLDVIAGSFKPTQVHWYENQGEEALRLGKQWPQHLLVDTGATSNEGQLMHDIDGDGRPEWIVNSWKPESPTVVWRLVPKDKPSKKSGDVAYTMKRQQLGESVNGHGVAVGDISGDGKADVLVGHGWYEQPAEAPWENEWTLHEDWQIHSSLPMLLVDLDEDGDNDLIFGNGHDFGLQWWEHQGQDSESGKISWDEHEIDRSFSQPHSMTWADVDGDGKKDLITGKRYYAHNGRDPGGKEVPCLYWYSWNFDKSNPANSTFTKHIIDEGRVGTGLQIIVEDINDDGRADIAVAGKSGTYLLLAKP